MFARLLLLFTAVPIVELYILIRIGNLIGALPTIGIVLVTGIAGAGLARRQGARVWLEIQSQMQQGVFPADSLIDGLLLVVAGAVLITPGVLTDILGFAILIPVTRIPIRNWVRARLSRMMDRGTIHYTEFLR
ncbi:MAG: FxsA family protein [Spirochaetaceae bacterium]